MTGEEQVIEQTKQWIKSVVIDCNFCPFAARVYNNQTIHYTVSDSSSIKEILPLLQAELELLDNDPATETAFLIFNEGFKNFDEYLSLVKKAERHLAKAGYEGIYQLASFHPDYCFQGAEDDDPANYTNRSMYPMLHLLREESISKALKFFPHPETIPETNVDFARTKGLPYMQMLLSACK
jgi:hypothetical protein